LRPVGKSKSRKIEAAYRGHWQKMQVPKWTKLDTQSVQRLTDDCAPEMTDINGAYSRSVRRGRIAKSPARSG